MPAGRSTSAIWARPLLYSDKLGQLGEKPATSVAEDLPPNFLVVDGRR